MEAVNAALLHDAAEAYVGDVSRPFKRFLPDYVKIEDHVQSCIRARFGLTSDETIWRLIGELDSEVLHLEARALLFHRYEWIKDLSTVTSTEAGTRLIDSGPLTQKQAKVEMSKMMRQYYLL
jgi:hypothetical protein